jgi:small subunit ribosomal protein S21
VANSQGEETETDRPALGEHGEKPLEVKVQNDRIEEAIKSLKRQMMKDGILKELRNRRAYEKPSVKSRRKQREARRRRLKASRRWTKDR